MTIDTLERDQPLLSSNTMREGLVLLCAQLGRQTSVAELGDGLPLTMGRLPPGLVVRALRRIDVTARIGEHPLDRIDAYLLPALLLLNDGQTLILTRYGDQSPMPAGEQLADLARHGATMAIHLGVKHLAKIVTDLRPHYGGDCPIAVVHRASWPDQDWVLGTLEDIEAKVAKKGFRRTALILVGSVLGNDVFSESALYRAGHAHLYRP